jgi:hypothetical protein
MHSDLQSDAAKPNANAAASLTVRIVNNMTIATAIVTAMTEKSVNCASCDYYFVTSQPQLLGL